MNISMPVKYCPSCGESIQNPTSLVNHFSESDDEVYFCWCKHCQWRCEIKPVQRVTIYELAEEE